MSNPKKRPTPGANQSVKKPRALLKKPKGPDYFNYLDDDCLSKIFKYLSIKQRLDVATVCKRWREASQLAWDDIKALNFHNPSLPWKGDSEELPPPYRSKNCIARILENCGGTLRELELGAHLNFNILRVIAQHCSNLTKLEIDVSNNAQISPIFIMQLQNLSYLKIEGNKHDFTEEVFRALPAETLTELHFSVNTMYSYSTLLAPAPRAYEILNKFTKLTALTLEGFTLEDDIITLISQKSQLTYLSLANVQDCYPSLDLSCLTNLEHLNLSSFESVDDDFMKQLSLNCKKLQHLIFRRCQDLNNYGITFLADLPQLEELDLAFNECFSDCYFRQLSQLKKLNVGNCFCVGDAGIIELVQCAPNLEYLNVVNTEVTDNLLQTAAGVTQSRTNNVPLKIIVKDTLKKAWEPKAALFPLLTVDVPGPRENYYQSEFGENGSDVNGGGSDVDDEDSDDDQSEDPESQNFIVRDNE